VITVILQDSLSELLTATVRLFKCHNILADCCTVWSGIGIIMSSVRPSVCNAEHCDPKGRCSGQNVVPACS